MKRAMRATSSIRINANTINMTIITTGLSPPFTQPKQPPRLENLNPPAKQAVVGGRQSQPGKQMQNGKVPQFGPQSPQFGIQAPQFGPQSPQFGIQLQFCIQSQLQIAPPAPPGPPARGPGIGTKKQHMNPGQYESW